MATLKVFDGSAWQFVAGQGANGAPGANGQGVPIGGSTGYVLTKRSGADYDTQWTEPPPLIQAGRFFGATNQYAQVGINYPIVFAAVPYVVATIEGTGSAPFVLYSHTSFSTASGVVFSVYLGANAYASGNIAFHWIAVGPRP